MEGDPVARELLRGAAQALASYTAAVRGQLFEPGEAVRIAGIGGVYRSRNPVRDVSYAGRTRGWMYAGRTGVRSGRGRAD